MTHTHKSFTTSDHAKMLSQLDKRNDRKIEYWSKNEIKTN